MYLLPPGIFKTFMAWMKKNYCESLEFMLSIFVVFVSNPPSRIYILDESQTKNYSFSLKLKITHPRNYIPTDKPKPIIHENCPLEFKWFHCIRPAHTNDNKWIRHWTKSVKIIKQNFELSITTSIYKYMYWYIVIHQLQSSTCLKIWFFLYIALTFQYLYFFLNMYNS